MAVVARAGISHSALSMEGATAAIGRPHGPVRGGLMPLFAAELPMEGTTKNFGRRNATQPIRLGQTPSALALPGGLGGSWRRVSMRVKRFGQTVASGGGGAGGNTTGKGQVFP
jgi:hypothetical protein